MTSQPLLIDPSVTFPHPSSVDPFIPPEGWPLHTIGAFETRLSICAQQARRMPDDAVYLLPAIEKLPRWAHALPATTEYCLMSIERITGCIDGAYFQEHTSKLTLEPWGVPCTENYACHYPWFEYFD
ncbi:hypothetical protein ACFU99_05845 [Streptomyces sp. NPDC057654]|uniref:hypothetical protein n=1 Tax=Streptomyces sp. NPDC057654 TaxID=3346196 RepID=UPI00369EF676